MCSFSTATFIHIYLHAHILNYIHHQNKHQQTFIRTYMYIHGTNNYGQINKLHFNNLAIRPLENLPAIINSSVTA